MSDRGSARGATGSAADDAEAASAATRKALKRQRREEQLAARARFEAVGRRRRLFLWSGGTLAVLLVVGGLTYWLTRPTVGPGGLPGPLGGPSIAQDVNTLIGQPAPAFTLPDSEGQAYAVTPGQGKPLVLVFHMGIT
jgi:hypothetical protein